MVWKHALAGWGRRVWGNLAGIWTFILFPSFLWGLDFPGMSPGTAKRYTVRSAWKGDSLLPVSVLEAGAAYRFQRSPFQVLSMEVLPQ